MKACKYQVGRWMLLSLCMHCVMLAAGAHAQIAVPARRQPSWLDTPISVEKKVRSFDATLKELSGILGRTILADGEPITQKLEEGYAGTAKEVLDRVADRFDFTWKVNSRGVILMNKRFNNPDEAPQMHLAEVQRMAKDAFNVFGLLGFDPDVAHTTQLRQQLYSSLIPEQRAALANGAHLTLQDLSQQQTGFVEQAIMNNALAVFYSVWRYLNALLSNAPAGALYAEVSHLQAGPRIDQTLPLFTLRFLYSTSDGRQIPAIIASENDR